MSDRFTTSVSVSKIALYIEGVFFSCKFIKDFKKKKFL